MKKILSLVICVVMMFGTMLPVGVMAEDAVPDASTEVSKSTVVYEDHFNESKSYGGWSTANGGEASRGIADDGDNKVFRIHAKKTSSSTGNADTVLEFKPDVAGLGIKNANTTPVDVSGVFELRFKSRMYARGNAFKLLYRSADAKWINIFANNGESFECPVGTKISSISVDTKWHDFSVMIDAKNRKYKVTRDAMVIYNGTISNDFKFEGAMLRFQAYSSGQTVTAYVDDLYLISHSSDEAYNGVAYENGFDGTKNEMLVKGRNGWATIGDSTNNQAKLELANYNGSDQIHSLSVRGANSTANADSTMKISDGVFFRGEWLIEADITPVRTNARLAIAFREEGKSSDYFYEIFSADHGTCKACLVKIPELSFEAGKTYNFKFYVNLFDNTASVYIDDVKYLSDMPFGSEPFNVSKYSLRIQNITSKNGDEGEYYFDNLSIRYKDIPKIILNGNAIERIKQGSTFEDPGATVVADKYNVPADALKVSGTVDTTEPGMSVLYYDAEVFGKSAGRVMRKVIVEPSELEFSNPVINESFDRTNLKDKGAFTGSWTDVKSDAKNYAFVGALDKDENRVIKVYTSRRNSETKNDMEATLARNNLNLNGLYKIDFDLCLTSGENNRVNVVLKDNTNNIIANYVYVVGNKLYVFNDKNYIDIPDGQWCSVSLKVDARDRKLYVDIDGVPMGSKSFDSKYSFENIAFRVQNWNAKTNALGEYAFLADNFSITSCTGRVDKPVVVFGEEGNNVTASVTAPSNLGDAKAVLAVYEGNKLTGIDFKSFEPDRYFDSQVTLEATDSDAETKRVSVIIVDAFGNMRPLTEGRTDAQ